MEGWSGNLLDCEMEAHQSLVQLGPAPGLSPFGADVKGCICPLCQTENIIKSLYMYVYGTLTFLFINQSTYSILRDHFEF